ncbi:hypothetical protein SRHO_G00012720 [Serrasalmus rhombeus]
MEHDHPGDIMQLVSQSFYVDNYLQSFSCREAAKETVDRLQKTLLKGGFQLRQWASNDLTTISHLPVEIRSGSSELWLSQQQTDIEESTLGMHWNCQSDALSYKTWSVGCSVITMQNIHKVLASQYDPLGYIVLYTTRAKSIEVRNNFCRLAATSPTLPDPEQYSTLGEFIKACALSLQSTSDPAQPTDIDYAEAELAVLCQAQVDSFPGEVACLKAGKPVPTTSQLLTLAPEFDHSCHLIRAGGRLRHSSLLEQNEIHPIVLSPHHPITKLIIKDYDNRLLHSGPERVFAEIRRKYWVSRGRQAVRLHQHKYSECVKWRGKPNHPRMADLPPARLRILKPAFYSTGVDCFGPYLIKIGRRNEKRWGVIFKYLTTRAVHIELLTNLDSDSLLMSRRGFVAKQGRPHVPAPRRRLPATDEKRPSLSVARSDALSVARSDALSDDIAESAWVVGWTHVGNFCHVPITLAGNPCVALVDTGSTATLMRPDLVPVETQLESTGVKLRTVTGEMAPMLGRGVVTVRVGEIPGSEHTEFSWGSHRYVRAAHANPTPSPSCCESRRNSKPPFTPPFLPQPPCPPTQSPARVHPSALDQQPVGEEIDRQAAVRGIWEWNCYNLEPQQRKEVWEVLREFKDIFALTEGEVGLTHLVQHEIDTGDAKPIKTRPRHLPLAHQAAADSAIEEMLRAGIIEPSDMVNKKKSQKIRFCVDYRPLNSVTKKDSYPLPRIDESLDLVSGSSWFSSLDLRSGYWQVPLSPDAKPKTAFCTGRGLWHFRVLSFSLCNAPATFEWLMEKVLAEIPRQECLVYLDDILVHRSSFKAALMSLQRTLQKIAAAGLKLHPDKCCFMRRELEFLGHRIGGEGISTMEEKVQVVQDWPTPSNLRELKSFIGLASYYRRFVCGFSCIAAPLFHLQRKGSDFVWTPECKQAFICLKKALTESPILTPPDPNLPFVLDTDASNVGMGAVLSQVGQEEYARRLQDRMESAHAFARDQLQKAGIRQKRNYDIRAKGKDFRAGDLVWVYSPKRKKGRCPKLDCHWVGPCEILEKLGEVVYRVQLPPRGRRVALHRDRLAPYRGDSRPHCRSGPSSLS